MYTKREQTRTGKYLPGIVWVVEGGVGVGDSRLSRLTTHTIAHAQLVMKTKLYLHKLRIAEITYLASVYTNIGCLNGKVIKSQMAP